jgi:hypothetical protein
MAQHGKTDSRTDEGSMVALDGKLCLRARRQQVVETPMVVFTFVISIKYSSVSDVGPAEEYARLKEKLPVGSSVFMGVDRGVTETWYDTVVMLRGKLATITEVGEAFGVGRGREDARFVEPAGGERVETFLEVWQNVSEHSGEVYGSRLEVGRGDEETQAMLAGIRAREESGIGLVSVLTELMVCYGRPENDGGGFSSSSSSSVS